MLYGSETHTVFKVEGSGNGVLRSTRGITWGDSWLNKIEDSEV